MQQPLAGASYKVNASTMLVEGFECLGPGKLLRLWDAPNMSKG